MDNKLGGLDSHLNGDKVDATLPGQRLGYHRLRAAGRSVHQQAFGRRNAKPLKGLWVLDGPLASLLQLVLELVLTTNILPAHLPNTST